MSRNISKQKSLSQWSRDDVLRWLQKHVGEGYYIAYGSSFKQHEITGATLVRLNEGTLIRMGIESHLHRNELLMKIEVLKLKSQQLELRNSTLNMSC